MIEINVLEILPGLDAFNWAFTVCLAFTLFSVTYMLILRAVTRT